MSNPWKTTEQRLLELLADRAVFGLELEEEQELRQLLQKIPDVDTECMQRAAATVQLTLAPVDPMPAAVRESIRDLGVRHVQASSRK